MKSVIETLMTLVSMLLVIGVCTALPKMVFAGNAYDPETGILTLDSVKVGNATYTDVTIKIIDHEVYTATLVVSVPPEETGSVGTTPDGQTCFIGMMPDCTPFDEIEPSGEDWIPLPPNNGGFTCFEDIPGSCDGEPGIDTPTDNNAGFGPAPLQPIPDDPAH